MGQTNTRPQDESFFPLTPHADGSFLFPLPSVVCMGGGLVGRECRMGIL